jgi:hypothetical protein
MFFCCYRETEFRRTRMLTKDINYAIDDAVHDYLLQHFQTKPLEHHWYDTYRVKVLDPIKALEDLNAQGRCYASLSMAILRYESKGTEIRASGHVKQYDLSVWDEYENDKVTLTRARVLGEHPVETSKVGDE